MIADTQITILMTENQARECIASIKQGLASLKEALWSLWVGRGWEALGYASFNACIIAEFPERSASTLFRLKDAAQVEKNIAAFENGEDAVNLLESHARVLNRLEGADDQFRAYTRGKAIAKAEGLEEPVARHFEQAVKFVEAERAVYSSPYHVITHMLASGDISAPVAAEMTKELDAVRITWRNQLEKVLTLISQHGLTCPALIPLIAFRYMRADKGEPSYVLEEIERTGCLGGTPLRLANMSDWANAKAESAKLKQAEADEAKRQAQIEAGETPVDIVPMNAYRGDGSRTVKALVIALQDDKEALEEVMLMLAGYLGWSRPLAGDEGVIEEVIVKYAKAG